MRTVPILIAAAALPLAAGAWAAAKPGATAAMADEAGAAKGSATLADTKAGVRVKLVATGLPPGVHGVHLHTTGKCEAPGFTSAGGHWNPTNMKHGKDSGMGPHEGDLPNVTVKADGTGKLDATIKGATLADLMDADGAALIVHAGADDYKTDPSGNSGGRVACGVVTAS